MSSAIHDTRPPQQPALPQSRTLRRLTVVASVVTRRLQNRSTWRDASWTLVVMTRNVLCSTAVGFLTNLWLSRGNMLSPLPPQQQTHQVYLTGVVLSAYIVNGILNVSLQAARLFPNRFARWPERRPSIFYCIFRMIRGSYMHLLVSLVCLTGVGLGCGRLSLRWRKLKPEFYIGCGFTQYYYAVLDMVARKIYQEETVNGQRKEAEKQQQRKEQAVQRPPRRQTLPRRVARVFLQNFPILMSIWFAGAYVHVVSISEISHGMQMMVFVLVSMVVKLIVQEIAKHYVMQHHVTHMKNMCIVVGIPTVLINTQVRIVIMSMNNTQSALLGTWVMAIFEVLLRFGKVVLLRWQIRARDPDRDSPPGPVASVVPPKSRASVSPIVAATEGGTTDAQSRFREWRLQMLALHTAEIYADMYAEYIAMGCSSSIYYFFADNKQYKLGVTSTGESTNTSYSSTNQLELVLIQVVVEIVVDFVSCIVEIVNGIDFDHLDGFGVFLGSLFTLTALLNISMSAVLYVAPKPSVAS